MDGWVFNTRIRIRETEMERIQEAKMERIREAEMERIQETEMKRIREAEMEQIREVEMEQIREAEMERIREAEMERIQTTLDPQHCWGLLGISVGLLGGWTFVQRAFVQGWHFGLFGHTKFVLLFS